MQQTIDSLEESRRLDQSELVKMREQLSLFQSEYTFYKEVAERLEMQQGSTLDQVNTRLRQLVEREKDLVASMTSLSEDNLKLGTQNRQYQ